MDKQNLGKQMKVSMTMCQYNKCNIKTDDDVTHLNVMEQSAEGEHVSDVIKVNDGAVFGNGIYHVNLLLCMFSFR